MEKTSHSLKREKLVFLSKRLLLYGSFLPFILIILPELRDNAMGRVSFGLIYCLYLFGIFSLVGKELDHQFKIYFRANSTVDRMLYRFISGYLVTGLFFYLFNLAPESFRGHLFWGYWAFWGLLYIWPTRAKILKEPFVKQVSEFKYLDKFEKLLVFLCAVLFFISVPYFQETYSLDIFVSQYDPTPYLHTAFWSSFNLLYQPIADQNILLTTSWFCFFYFMSYIVLLVAGYCLLRFFFNRRLSLLGVFSMAASWAIVLTAESSLIYGAFISSFSIMWIWALLWIQRSATYRSGLFIGMVASYGYILYNGNFLFYPASLLLAWFILFREKTSWFKKQFVKYTLVGAVSLLIIALTDKRDWKSVFSFDHGQIFEQWHYNFFHKDFYILSILGLILISLFILNIKNFAFKHKIYNKELFEVFLVCIGSLCAISLLFSPQNISYINSLWMMTFCSLVPLEWLFQAVRRLRSKSNLIYGIYIVICLLDSRIEGRIKNVMKFLDI